MSMIESPPHDITKYKELNGDDTDEIDSSDIAIELNNNDVSKSKSVEQIALETSIDDNDGNDQDDGGDTFNVVLTSPKSKRQLSPKQLSSCGSDSFGSSVSAHTHDTLETFATLSNRSYESPRHATFSNTPDSLNSHKTPPTRGENMLREDSFDRKKATFKTTHKANAKMERAKILGINEYTFLKTLGKGAFAEVKLATKSKLENDDVVRDLNVHNFERYAIKIIKKNFMQDKRKFQAATSQRNISTPKTPTVSFKSGLVTDEKSGENNGDQKTVLKPTTTSTPPRASGRSLRMKNKKFQNAANTTTGTGAGTTSSSTNTTPSSVMTTASIDPSSNVTENKPISGSSSNGNGIAGNGSPVRTPTLTVNTLNPSSSSTTPPLPTSSPKHPERSPVAEEVLQELEILKFLRHKNLVKLCEIIDDPSSKHLYAVMEYVPAGPIMIHDSATGNFYSRLTGGVLLESMASNVFKDLMSVLEYLHLNHIAHRDLKPDNLLVDYQGTLKVSDFGVSNHFSEEKRKKAVNMRQLSRSKSRGVVNSTEGTFAFYSPEMCRENSGGYSAYMSDVWAASVCLWIFIFGKLPLYTPDVVDLFALIRTQEPVKPHRVSPELTHLLDKILQKDQDNRLSIHDIQNHCWLKRCPLKGNGISSDDFETDDDLDSHLDEVKKLFSTRVKAKIMKWAQSARDKCRLRNEKYMKDMDTELEAMLRRSSISFKNTETDSDCGHSSDDDDPLARLVSYDEIGGTVLEDIKKHEERQAALKQMTSVAEGDEGRSPAQITPPKQKKPLRMGRKSKTALNYDELNSSLSKSSSKSSNSTVASDLMSPTLDIHERLTQEAIVALELETFTLNTNKELKEKELEKQSKITPCCVLS